MPRSPQIAMLQVGRAIAAIAVVLYHATQMTVGLTGPFPGSSVLLHGDLGVDFFFVLSGFIIYHSAAGASPGAFVHARARRIYLPYLPVGIGMALFFSVIGLNMNGWSWLPSLTLAPIGRPALAVAWTLQHEIVFYAVFALSYFSGRLLTGLGIWAILIVVGTLARVTFIPFAPLNLEFLMGVAAAMAFRRGWGGIRWFALASLPLLLWIILGARTDMSVLIGLTIALIIVPVAGWERGGTKIVPRPFLFLGAASYSIYLVHAVAISVVTRLVSGWAWMMLTAVGASITVGLIYHLAVERPLLRLDLGMIGRLSVSKRRLWKRTV